MGPMASGTTISTVKEARPDFGQHESTPPLQKSNVGCCGPDARATMAATTDFDDKTVFPLQ